MTDISTAADPELLQTVVVAKDPIGNLGGAWMSVPAEQEATAAAGLVDWQLYFLGRHGVMGDVDADVVTAAAYVFPAEYLRQEWRAARSKLTPAEGLERYVAVCHGWGRETLADFAAADRLSVLAAKVIDAADVAGLPLFAGWRAVPVPADSAARCAHLMQVLREHRGACHGVALVALGMKPLIAILCNQGGEQNAQEYGWQPPYPVVTAADQERRNRVEELTDDLVASAYAGLTVAERGEFVDLLSAAAVHCFGE